MHVRNLLIALGFCFPLACNDGGSAFPNTTPEPDPVAADDVYTATEDQPLAIGAEAGVLANDTITSTGAAVLEAPPAYGQVTLSTDGAFTYTPQPDFNGADSFTYRNPSPATVKINVNPVDDVPVTADDAFIITEDTTLGVVAPGVLGNDIDVDGDILIASIAQPPTHGTVTLSPDGAFEYTPDAFYNGEDQFSYKVATEPGTSGGGATVFIMIDSVPNQPLTNDDAYVGMEGQTLDIAAPGILSNDTDPDGDLLVALQASGPQNGSVSVGLDGSFTYTPDAGFSGTDQFSYRATDGIMISSPAVVTIAVAADPGGGGGGNTSPTAFDDFAETDENLPVTLDVLFNDSDPEGDMLTVVSYGQGAHGTVMASGNLLTYTPDAGYSGGDVFYYIIDDIHGASDIAVVNINVKAAGGGGGGGGGPADAIDDFVSTSAGVPVTVNVLANDNGVGLQVVSYGQGADGMVSINADDTLTYTPDNGFTGTDTFYYNIWDEDENASLGLVTVTVN